MGMGSQNSASAGQVYYDNSTGQYYTLGNNITYNPSNPGPAPTPQNSLTDTISMFFGKNNQRNYLTNPYNSNSFANRFTPKNIPANYPEMDMLFPALNAGLASGIISSTQPDGAMLGAGRFIAPQTTNTQGK
jgi:hypothetical protein